MARFAPFESQPRLAVAVSGGRDSLALAVLLLAWTTARKGRLTALTVDHGLRPDSAAEARRVGAWLRRLGIRQRILTWQGAKPTSNVQAQAREARYGLMSDWCRRNGVLHLALAHHLEDQAETVLLRLARGSGLQGLAGMAASAHGPDLRVIRPLLDYPRARLTATLDALGQAWIEDPNNRDPAFARVRLRGLLSGPEAGALAREGLDSLRLAQTAAHLGRARGALDRAAARLLAEAAWIHPLGHAWLARDRLARAHEDIQLRALAQLLTTVGGAAYGPRYERLCRLRARLAGDPAQTPPFRGATLGGCTLLPRASGLLIAREPRSCPRQALGPGRIRWDERFEIEIRGEPAGQLAGLAVGPLGEAGRVQLKRDTDASGSAARVFPVPNQALRSLPGLWREDRLLAAPDLQFWAESMLAKAVKRWAFAPKNPLTQDWFTVA